MTTTLTRCSRLLAWVSLSASLSACGGQSLDVGSRLDAEGGEGGGAGASGGDPGAGGAGEAPPAPRCPCSRRPGVNNSFRCTQGVGESASAVVGEAGGVVMLEARQSASSGVTFKVEVPPRTLASEVTLRVIETESAPPAELIDYSPVYLIEPTSLELPRSASLTIPFGNLDGPFAGLNIYWAPTADGPFEPLADSYTNAGFMQGSTTRFGAFVVAAPRTAEQTACP